MFFYILKHESPRISAVTGQMDEPGGEFKYLGNWDTQVHLRCSGEQLGESQFNQWGWQP